MAASYSGGTDSTHSSKAGYSHVGNKMRGTHPLQIRNAHRRTNPPDDARKHTRSIAVTWHLCVLEPAIAQPSTFGIVASVHRAFATSLMSGAVGTTAAHPSLP
jgi:hypothetical protein